jgi:tRNA (cmo5U34)-methyltransferase
MLRSCFQREGTEVQLDASSLFANPADVAAYAVTTARKVPGLDALHRMVTQLLAEGAPADARILVLGAGGGLELRAMASTCGAWSFTGVDPSPAMLDLAREATSPFADRISLVTGTIEQSPAGPFDGATCLLTLHFLTRSERLLALQGIRSRLNPGARLVVAHHCAPAGNAERWMARSVAFGQEAGSQGFNVNAMGKTMAARLPLLTPCAEEDLLREAGFADVELFYGALSFRGWVATACH